MNPGLTFTEREGTPLLPLSFFKKKNQQNIFLTVPTELKSYQHQKRVPNIEYLI